MKNKTKLIEIEFEDLGQDFLKWTIEYQGINAEDYILGKVVDCEPFQRDHWTDYYVISGKPKIGECVTISLSPKDDTITIKYPITAIKELENAV